MSTQSVQLGSIAKVLNGYAFKSKEYVEDGIRIIRITNVQKGCIQDDNPKYIDVERTNEFTRFMLDSGDILISLTGNVGRVGVLGDSLLPAALNQRVGALKIKSDQVLPRYLFHLLNSDDFEREAIKNSKGIAQLNLSSKWIEQYDIPLPPLSEQKRIAGILDAADALRAKRRDALAQLDTLLQATFLDMFGDPVTNPKGWKKSTLNDVAVKVTDGEHLNPPFAQAGMPMVMAGNVLETGVDLTNIKYVEHKLGSKFRRKCGPDRDDLLLVSRGATIGRMCMVDSDEDFCLMGSVILIKVDHELTTPAFLTGFLRCPAIRRDLYKTSGSSAQQAIYIKDIRKLKCLVPPFEVQRQYGDLVASVNKQKRIGITHLSELDTLFASLQQRAFAGEL